MLVRGKPSPQVPGAVGHQEADDNLRGDGGDSWHGHRYDRNRAGEACARASKNRRALPRTGLYGGRDRVLRVAAAGEVSELRRAVCGEGSNHESAGYGLEPERGMERNRGAAGARTRTTARVVGQSCGVRAQTRSEAAAPEPDAFEGRGDRA